MKYISICISIFCVFHLNAQTYEDSIIELRVVQMGEMIDSSKHILKQDEIDQFEGLAFFKVDSNYRITAKFTKSIGKKFEMPTTTDRKPIYRRFGYADFKLNGEKYRLTIYQNMGLIKQKEYKKYLFIPFRDSTSGNETYGGGRYIDTEIPSGKTLILDFNRSYNPYCAYSHRYSCPIPPEENTLKVTIYAGEKVPVGFEKQH
ncbi:MAG: DUF1684 domain-containing protein [Flavobacteriia bacterium]